MIKHKIFQNPLDFRKFDVNLICHFADSTVIDDVKKKPRIYTLLYVAADIIYILLIWYTVKMMGAVDVPNYPIGKPLQSLCRVFFVSCLISLRVIVRAGFGSKVQQNQQPPRDNQLIIVNKQKPKRASRRLRPNNLNQFN